MDNRYREAANAFLGELCIVSTMLDLVLNGKPKDGDYKYIKQQWENHGREKVLAVVNKYAPTQENKNAEAGPKESPEQGKVGD